MKKWKEVLLFIISGLFFFAPPLQTFAAKAEASKTIPSLSGRQDSTPYDKFKILEPFNPGARQTDLFRSSTDEKQNFMMTGGSYSFANGAAARLGLDALMQKRVNDLSGKTQGRLEDLLISGNGISTLGSSQYSLTSVSISYPVSHRLTLDGGYAVVKKEGRANGQFSGSLERRIPSLGASYTINTNTSISVNYHRAKVKEPNAKKGREEHEASAELRINF